ncbi:hypothetical protein JG687_00013183, partial [Phytophthora cactorum]
LSCVRPRSFLRFSTRYVDLKFHKTAAHRCWFLIISARVPAPVGGEAVASCSVEGNIAFGNFSDQRHPFHRCLHLLPDHASIYDSTTVDINLTVSPRAPLALRYFYLWQSLRGEGHPSS